MPRVLFDVKWLISASEELIPKKGTLKMVTVKCLVLGLTCHSSLHNRDFSGLRFAVWNK